MTHNPRTDKLARLMVVPEQQFIFPIQLAEMHEGISGNVPLNRLPRLKEVLLDSDGSVRYELHFGKDEQGVVIISGEFSVDLRLRCQRCMQSMDLPVKNRVRLGVENPSNPGWNQNDYEPVRLTDNRISLEAVLEDEILLALPMIPAHALNDCNAGQLVDMNRSGAASPFAVLKDLKLDK